VRRVLGAGVQVYHRHGPLLRGVAEAAAGDEQIAQAYAAMRARFDDLAEQSLRGVADLKRTVIGDESDRYDEVIAVWYPTLAAFAALATDPEVLAARAHRVAGLERAALICCESGRRGRARWPGGILRFSVTCRAALSAAIDRQATRDKRSAVLPSSRKRNDRTFAATALGGPPLTSGSVVSMDSIGALVGVGGDGLG
jgi:hypothetical protein